MNYNSLMNKPTINYKELIGDNTVTEVGGITEEQFNTLLSTDLSSYYTKAQIDDLFSRSFVYREKSGPIVTFDCPSTSQSIPEVTVGIEAVQDLHGYDSPWVGGAGKNKLQVTATTTTKDGVTFTVKEDGTIAVTGTKSSSSSTRIWLDIAVNISFSNDVILNGCPSGGGNTTYKIAGFLGDTGTGDYNDIGSGVTIPANTMLKTLSIGIAQQGNISLVFKPMIRLATVSDGTFAPYENICPISGWSAVNVYDGPTTGPQDATVYTTALKDANDQPLTCYGGQLENVNGVQTLTVTHANIASYNGETINEPWISSMDVYSEGATPTTGAQVVYSLATSTEIPQQSQAISTQDGTNNLWADTGDIEVKCLDRIIPAEE